MRDDDLHFNSRAHCAVEARVMVVAALCFAIGVVCLAMALSAFDPAPPAPTITRETSP